MAKLERPEKSKKAQWRLSTLLIVMLGFAFIFAGIANMHSVVDMDVNFQTLPPNDDGLAAWLKKTYRASSISIKRPEEKTVAIQFSRAVFKLDVPQPPWDQWGYGPLNSLVFAQTQVTGWWIPIGLLILLSAGFLSRVLGRLGQGFRAPAPRESPLGGSA